MVSKILPVVAFAGAAVAAVCPTVEISGATNHIVDVKITNVDATPITIFKGNTVLSDHATQDLMVENASGESLTFEGIYVNHKKVGIAAEHFVTILPGESITAPVNAAKIYNLGKVASAKVTAVQNLQIAAGAAAPTSLKETTLCSAVSNTVSIVPDQKIAASQLISRDAPTRSRIQKRAITYSSCTAAQTTSLKTSVADAISMASAAYTAAGSAADYFTTWFIATSQETKVRTIYNSVKNVQTTSPKISCADTYGDCSDGSALLYTVPSANVIVPCPNNGFWSFPELAPACAGDDYDKAGSILHEMTHLYGTTDYAYGPDAAKKLTATKASANADTYEMYAESVRLGGCTTG